MQIEYVILSKNEGEKKSADMKRDNSLKILNSQFNKIINQLIVH